MQHGSPPGVGVGVGPSQGHFAAQSLLARSTQKLSQPVPGSQQSGSVSQTQFWQEATAHPIPACSSQQSPPAAVGVPVAVHVPVSVRVPVIVGVPLFVRVGVRVRVDVAVRVGVLESVVGVTVGATSVAVGGTSVAVGTISVGVGGMSVGVGVGVEVASGAAWQSAPQASTHAIPPRAGSAQRTSSHATAQHEGSRAHTQIWHAGSSHPASACARQQSLAGVGVSSWAPDSTESSRVERSGDESGNDEPPCRGAARRPHRVRPRPAVREGSAAVRAGALR